MLLTNAAASELRYARHRTEMTDSGMLMLSKSVKKNVLDAVYEYESLHDPIRNHKLKCLWIHTDPDPQLLCECLSYLAHCFLIFF